MNFIPMLVHSVYFWLKPELTAAQLRAVLASCEVIAVQPDEAVPPS